MNEQILNDKEMINESEIFYITYLSPSSWSSKKEYLYLYDDEDKAERYSMHLDKENKEEWRNYKENNTWYSPEEGMHFVESEDESEKPYYPEHARFGYEEVKLEDENVSLLFLNNRYVLSDKNREKLSALFCKQKFIEQTEKSNIEK